MTLSKGDGILSIEHQLLFLYINILSVSACRYWGGAVALRLENSNIFQSTRPALDCHSFNTRYITSSEVQAVGISQQSAFLATLALLGLAYF